MNTKIFLLFILPIAPFFIHLNFFNSYEDIKYIAFLVIFPLLIIYSLQYQIPTNQCEHKKNHCGIPVLLLAILVCYTFANWYMLSNPYHGNRAIILFWISILSFFLGTGIHDKYYTTLFVPALITIGSIASIIGILEYAGYMQTTAGYFPPQPSGFIGHKNMFSFVLMVSSIMTFASAIEYFQQKHSRWVLLLFSFIIHLFALFISDSRGPLITALLSVFILLLYNFWTEIKRNGWLRIVLYVSLSAIILIPLYFWNEVTLLRYMALLQGTDTYGRAPGQSARPVFFYSMIRLLLDKPLFGAGIGNFITESIKYWPLSFRKMMYTKIMLPDAGHNDYLQAWCELGVFGGTIYNFFWVGALVLAVKQFIKTNAPQSLAVLLCFITIALHAGYNTATRHIPTTVVAWVFIGFLWKDYFTTHPILTTKKTKSWFALCITFISLLCLFLAIQISIGDYFFFQSEIARVKKSSQQIQNELLLKSITYCPYHPEANYKFAYFAGREGKYKAALAACDYLDEKYPNTFPTDFVRTFTYYANENYDSTLLYSEKLLRQWPNYSKVYIYQAQAYSKLNKCSELFRLQKYISKSSGISPDKNAPEIKNDSAPVETKPTGLEYFGFLSNFQKKFGGPYIKNAYQIYMHTPRSDNAALLNSYHAIISLECDSNNTAQK
jgi:O-antigen ligase